MGLIDALADPQFRRDVYNGVNDTVGRTVAGALGAPVDMAENVVNLGLAGTGWAGHETSGQGSEYMPGLISHAVGGSEWIGDRMRDAGLVSDRRNPVAEFLGGLVQPGGGGLHARDALGALSGLNSASRAMGPMFEIIARSGADKLRQGVETRLGGGRYKLGDTTEGQGMQADTLFGSPTPSRDVYMTDNTLNHILDKRVDADNFTADDLLRFAEQALSRRSRVVQDPSKANQNPMLVNEGVRDAETGRRYDAQMPLRQVEDGYEVRSIIPRGLPPRNKKPPG